MEDEKVIRISMARLAPSWLVAGAYGFVVGLVLAIIELGAAALVYVLGLVSLVLVYFVFKIYNQFANYYNSMKIKDLAANQEILDLFTQLDGTFQDETCLTSTEDEDDESTKDS